MRRAACLGVLLLTAGSARAATPGGTACGRVVSDAQAQCQARSAASATLEKLQDELSKQQDAAAKAAKQAEVTAAQKRVTELEKDPFADWCEALTGVNAAPTCDRLASLLSADLDQPNVDEVAETRQKLAADAALAQQPDRQTSTNKSGSAAQTDPVESIQPISLAGGALTLAGTRSGTKGVGTITVNPLALTKPEDAALGRVFDLTVSAPFDLDGGTGQDQRYFSTRLRVNATAPISAARLNRALKSFAVAEGKLADDLESVLERAPNAKACAVSVLKTRKVTKEACGETLTSEYVRQLHDVAYAEVAAAQRAADAYYVGIDARFDTGDPTGTVIVGDKGTHLLGAAAAGVRVPLGSGLWDFELRGRVGGDYFKSRDDAAGTDPKPVFSVDWGAALILSGRLQELAKQRMAFGIGVEGRHAGSSANDVLAPTNYANLNLMAVVPATSGGDIGLSFSIPVADSVIPRGTIVSLSTDLGVLDRATR